MQGLEREPMKTESALHKEKSYTMEPVMPGQTILWLMLSRQWNSSRENHEKHGILTKQSIDGRGLQAASDSLTGNRVLFGKRLIYITTNTKQIAWTYSSLKLWDSLLKKKKKPDSFRAHNFFCLVWQGEIMTSKIEGYWARLLLTWAWEPPTTTTTTKIMKKWHNNPRNHKDTKMKKH